MTTQEPDNLYLTIEEIATELRINRHTVRALMRYDGLPAVKVGSRYRISRADLDRWIADSKKEAKE